MSDVPLGAMLSGGLDSSLIVALMARHMSEPVKTFSVGFTEAGESNELADARDVAALFGADHHELELSFVQQDVELADLAWHIDEPLADLSSLGFLALSRARRETRHRRASGQGADELLGGYSRHRNAALASRASAGCRGRRGGLVTRPPGRAPRRFRTAAAVLRAADPVAASSWPTRNMDDAPPRAARARRAARPARARRAHRVAERLRRRRTAIRSR